MMNKPLLVFLAGAIVLIALGVGSYLSLQSTVNAPIVTPIETAAPETFSSTLINLFQQGESLQCNFVSDTESGEVIGTIFTDGNITQHLAGNFITSPTESAPAYTGNIIVDGEYSYFWSSDQTQGLKTKLDPEEPSLFQQTPDTDSSNSAALSDTEPIEFTCMPWSPDPAVFIPPSDVTFVEFSAQMESSISPPAGTPQDPCTACNQIPAGQAQDQCKAALGCPAL